uniref:RnfABCDGE type electron transport complex subunit G n=1 Tax=Ndongobacter massiliensis TaxID=1871025 RepID=UPI0009301700|nr:RnfABCDGE type electron transport complex subunit G [Ndongobacter massiliensis]
MKKALILAVKLLVICAVAAAALALVNSATLPVIQARQAEETKQAYSAVYPDADELNILEDKSLLNENILEIVEAKKGGQLDGYIFKAASPAGYDGPVTFVIGAKVDGTVTGFEVLEHTETQGFGARVANPEYAEGMNGVTLTEPVTAEGAGGQPHAIPAMSGATLTTNAMVEGINKVVEKWAELTGSEVDMSANVVQATDEQLQAVYPDAEEIVEGEYPQALNDIVIKIYDAKKGGSVIGHVYRVTSPRGFGGSVECLVAVDSSDAVQGFLVLSHLETEGYGAAVADEEYAQALVGKKVSEEPTAISGATLTSEAMKAAFAAVAEAQSMVK